MGKSIDITKVNLSPKGILWLIVGVVVIIGVWQIGNWGFSKLKGTATTVTSRFQSV